MEHQSGYRFHEWGSDVVWEDFPRPEAKPGEVLVEVEACGVGLTVLNWMTGDLTDAPELLPRVPGHELVGRVVSVPDPADSHLTNRRVVAHAYLFCGVCLACIKGEEPRCQNLAGWIGLHRDGGYAPYAVIPSRNAVPVDDLLDPISATVVPDAVSTSVHVCRTRAQVAPGDRVAVVGAGGGVGIHMVQVARLLGASVAGLDVDDEKLEALEGLQVSAVDSRNLSALDGQRLWDAGPPTVVVDLVGNKATLAWSLDALGMGGRLLILTTFRDRTLEVDPRAVVSREISILASRSASRAEYVLAAELVTRGLVRPVIGSVATPDRIDEIHQALSDGTLLGRGALDWTAGAHGAAPAPTSVRGE